MSIMKLVRRNLARNKLRAFLTVSSIALVLFLMAFILTALEVIQPQQDDAVTLRVITRHATSLNFAMPRSYWQRIREIPGVVQVTPSNWFGGIYIDERNFFGQFAVDPETFMDVYPDIELDPEARDALLNERTACVVAPKLAEMYGWKVGDKIPLKGTIYPFTLELTLRGIYHREGKEDYPTLYFNWHYLDDRMNQAGQVGTFDVRVDSVEKLAPVSEAIDRMFENSDTPTKTETEEAFMAGFTSMWGNVAGLVRNIGLAAVFTIIMVAANTMAMSTRERVTEVAVLKALGFERGRIFGILIGESVGMSLLGALLGAGGAKLLFDLFDVSKVPGIGNFINYFQVSWPTFFLCVSVALVVGVLSGGIPAWQSARLSIVDGLRRVA